VIRTKAVPLLGRDVASFKADYEAYFERNQAHVRQPLTMLDPAPRVVLDSTLGMIGIGNSVKAANIARDIYQHTIEIILRAEQLGGFRALPDEDLFDIEYWELEQAKLKRAGKPPVLTGEIALVTGAASGIGKASVEALLKRGAAVIGLDINPTITELFSNPAFLGLTCDLRDEAALQAALERGVRAFGGIDIAVLNAGIFPPSQQIKEMKIENWRQSMSINLDANLILMRELHPLLKLAPRQGKVVIIGSKNVLAPGPGAAAYSASKAALNQLARVAALEWGKDGIRVNTVHPNAVFDTAIWTEEILTARAASYGLSVAEYKTRNVMQVEVTSHDVAEVVAQLCGPSYAKTTGAQIPIDGGNLRVI
jgi:NAD(P)-dependent dehydrogenase (short-subunit alcohol dehydrogenase family)